MSSYQRLESNWGGGGAWLRNELAFADRQAQTDGVTLRGSEGNFPRFSWGVNHAVWERGETTEALWAEAQGSRPSLGLLLSTILTCAKTSALACDFVICCPHFTSHLTLENIEAR